MNFAPKQEKDLVTLLDAGEYAIDIIGAADKVSKTSGKDMIELKIRAYGKDDRSYLLFDYLMESVAYKLRHACACFGLLEKYNTGTIQAVDFEGKGGRAIIGIQKDKTGQYKDKNVISDYIYLDGGKQGAEDYPF